MKIFRIILIVILSITIILSCFMIIKHYIDKAEASRPVDEVLAERFGEYTPTELELELFNLTNEAREKEGLAPYRNETGLHSLAFIRAKEAKELWSHTRPDGRHFGTVIEDEGLEVYFELIGENLGKGFESAEKIHEKLMDSPDHRKNILNSEYDGVCIAVYTDGDGVGYLCQTFVKRR